MNHRLSPAKSPAFDFASVSLTRQYYLGTVKLGLEIESGGDAVSRIDLEMLGPLKGLAGSWEGDQGDDIAPSDDRGTERNFFREHIRLEPFAAPTNHEQKLYGLRYATSAIRKGESEPFHEETGYWLWDPRDSQVLRCFVLPRGITVLAGGTVAPMATQFELRAKLGSPIYGICSNPFLDREFQTVEYILHVTMHDQSTFSYEEDTHIRIKGVSELFHHIDKNILKRM